MRTIRDKRCLTLLLTCLVGIRKTALDALGKGLPPGIEERNPRRQVSVELTAACVDIGQVASMVREVSNQTLAAFRLGVAPPLDEGPDQSAVTKVGRDPLGPGRCGDDRTLRRL
jgi:hypothetical protein